MNIYLNEYRKKKEEIIKFKQIILQVWRWQM
jgi:hypothetical protein